MGCVSEGMPQKITVQAVTRKGYVDLGTCKDGVLVVDLRVVCENFRDLLIEDVADIS